MKRWVLTALTLSLMTVGIYSLVNDNHKALAVADVPVCSNTYLDIWNWPKAVAGTDVSPPNSGGLVDFNVSSSSYIVWKHAGSTSNDFYLTEASANKELVMSYDSVSDKQKVYNGNATNVHIHSQPSSIPAYSFEGSFSHKGMYASTNGTISDPFSLSPSEADCVVVAHNVVYDGTFTNTHYKANQTFSSTNPADCKLTDVFCWAGRIVDGIDNTFQSVGMAIFDGLSQLFAPSGTVISQDFTDFNTFLQAKLGFFAYPITFIVNMFNAFSSSTTGCNTSSCNIDFGNFYGHDFKINYLAPDQISTSIWTYLRLVIQSITVLALVLGVYRKILAISTGGNVQE
jgi:hypothetical protein